MKTATSKDWKTKPLPKKRSLIPADRQFTSREMDCIKRGFIPMAMEEKWFVFFKRNRLYFHRSWTGYCVFVAHFKRSQDGYVLHLIEANRNRRQYLETDNAADARLVSDIIDNFLLAPQTSKGPAGLVAALDQASKPNYLGDPKVVSKLLRDFSDAALRRRASGMDAEEAHLRDQGHALALADIFLGMVPAYAPIIPWNSPGQIDKWLTTEIFWSEIAGETPELTVANAMACYLDQVYEFGKYMAHSPQSDGWLNTEIDKNIVHYTHLLLGIPYNNDEDDEPAKEEDDEL
jgi:hypothetical protein